MAEALVMLPRTNQTVVCRSGRRLGASRLSYVMACLGQLQSWVPVRPPSRHALSPSLQHIGRLIRESFAASRCCQVVLTIPCISGQSDDGNHFDHAARVATYCCVTQRILRGSKRRQSAAETRASLKGSIPFDEHRVVLVSSCPVLLA